MCLWPCCGDGTTPGCGAIFSADDETETLSGTLAWEATSTASFWTTTGTGAAIRRRAIVFDGSNTMAVFLHGYQYRDPKPTTGAVWCGVADSVGLAYDFAAQELRLVTLDANGEIASVLVSVTVSRADWHRTYSGVPASDFPRAALYWTRWSTGDVVHAWVRYLNSSNTAVILWLTADRPQAFPTSGDVAVLGASVAAIRHYGVLSCSAQQGCSIDGLGPPPDTYYVSGTFALTSGNGAMTVTTNPVTLTSGVLAQDASRWNPPTPRARCLWNASTGQSTTYTNNTPFNGELYGELFSATELELVSGQPLTTQGTYMSGCPTVVSPLTDAGPLVDLNLQVPSGTTWLIMLRAKDVNATPNPDVLHFQTAIYTTTSTLSQSGNTTFTRLGVVQQALTHNVITSPGCVTEFIDSTGWPTTLTCSPI